MKKRFLAKRGILPVFLTYGLYLLISLMISSILASVLHRLFQLNELCLFLCLVLISNLLFIPKTSFVKIDDDTIEYHHYLFARKMRLNFEDIISYTVLDAKEYQNLCNNLTRNNNLSANCLSTFIPLNRNVILFKDNEYQEVAICVYNFDEFYHFIQNKLELNEKNL
ncbi:MAG: hypothetical protein K2K01_06860, partial [Eubacterium sp.]|nr:hypothetical protein [Eubacterium sp.]